MASPKGPPSPVTRRRFLRGLGGAALALPLLDAFVPQRVGASAFPTRLVIVFTPNGTVPDAWLGGDGTSLVLGELLAPLAPHQGDLVVLTGIDAESSYHGPGDNSHGNAMGHMLTGTEMVGADGAYWAGGISVDQRVAQAIGGDTRFPSLQLAVEDHPAGVTTRMSYLGAARPLPPEPDPAMLFRRLFDGATAAVIDQRRSVLDAVKDDLGTLSAELGAADRQKIEAHLDAVRASEKILLAPPGACTASAVGPVDLGDMPAVGDAHTGLLVRALACDLTRVVTLQWSAAVSSTRMTWIGIDEGHHALSHRSLEDEGVRRRLVAVDRWYAGRFAALLAAMKAVPEGDGTLLDHSLVVWCNELSLGQVHDRRDLSYVLAGRAGGALPTGRLLRYGAAVGQPAPPHNDLLVSICHAMGVPVTTFGNPAYCNGPLPGLLA